MEQNNCTSLKNIIISKIVVWFFAHMCKMLVSTQKSVNLYKSVGI